MQQSKLFLSSCTRRQLARRRAGRAAFRMQQLLLVSLMVVAAVTAFMAGRGGF
jgi:hypothetical protein